jgi:protein-disulfide isomerase
MRLRIFSTLASERHVPGRSAILAPLLASVLLLAMPGCTRDPSPSADRSARPSAAEPGTNVVVATLGARKITSAEVDALVAAQLHEIDYQRYLLRRQATEALLLQELAASQGKLQTASIRLVPPRPPAVKLSGAPAGLRPVAATPVTVSVFCDFESPHCAALQAVLSDLLALYPGSVRIAARDLPLPIHGHARLAAEAARCAGRQDQYWKYQDQLWARGRVPERAELDAVAQVVGLDLSGFQRCLDEHAESDAVAADVELARGLGLAMVPAVFVNGRRATAPATPDQLMHLVEEALKEVLPARDEPRPTQPTNLPIVLRATIVGAGPGLGLAVIGGAEPDAPSSVRREGERVTPEAILRRVRADSVELLVDGRVEVMAFGAAPRSGTSTGDSADEDGGSQGRDATAVSGISPMQVYLDREMVRELMADRVALSAQLKPQPLTVDGYRLLKLEEVPPGSLYELLGLQPGDVIVMVNEQPIHEGDNPLWDALDRDQEVRLRVMRRGGLAQHYTYRFE